ncbi:GAF domain-containing protein [Cytophagaceae bacterium BD1B2-1]|uniref:GAF domain-containing protein n=2 Tax=Xanthocytophaga agilis TaxID=3048010 RepID=A0AAE3R7Z8_9BACT|nr:GAF domain-containing protein [Xanthocytophaga agilis]
MKQAKKTMPFDLPLKLTFIVLSGTLTFVAFLLFQESYFVRGIVLIIAALLGVGLYWLIYSQLLKPIKGLGYVTDQIVKGNHISTFHFKSIHTDLMGLLKSIDFLREELYVSEQIITNIEAGNFDTNTYTADKNKYRLVDALLRMQNQMKMVEEESRRRHWATQGLAHFSEILRNHTLNRQELADTVLSSLIKYLNANQGGLFIVNEQDTKDIHFELISSYAYERKKYLKKRIDIGEGLVGQLYLEKDTIFLTDIPSDYISITSGLGKANPTCILLVPLKNNDQVEGAIEIASFQAFEPYQIEFVEKLAESISSAIVSAKVSEQTKRLLEETRLQTEFLKAQEEEMRQNMEEMAATQEEMQRMQNELSHKESNLQAVINCTDDSMTAMDTNYRITLMNDVIRQRYANSQFSDFKEGANALDYLGNVRDEWKQRYDRALAGEKFDFVAKSVVQGEDCYRQYIVGPIFTAEQRVRGIYVFSRDITHVKTLEIAYEELLSRLELQESEN